MPSGQRPRPPHVVRRIVVACVAMASLAAAFASRAGAETAAAAPPTSAISPIQHVVVLFQENHAFNDLLGKLCVDEGHRCAGSTTGVISDGTKIELTNEPDVVPAVGHAIADQTAAMDRGRMDGWDRVEGCSAPEHYACLTQAYAGAVPTLWKLADKFVISDRTFETDAVSSWGSHLELAAATMDGFLGDQPTGGTSGPGGGCDSGKDEWWTPSAGQAPIEVPSCVPDKKGRGPYRTSPVRYVPTIMDRVEAAGLSWKLYSPSSKNVGYGWAICPTFYECLGSGQARRVKPAADVVRDARNGRLPSLSIVVPNPEDSQHNSRSLMQGDNWIARAVHAIMRGPDWSSTAIFITYDDCGCFYDPVRPPRGDGIRVPMVIVSPYAKPGFVDHAKASFVSMLAFAEHTLGLAPLSQLDANAYDYANAFDFSQRPNPPIDLPQHAVPASSLRWIADHPPPADDPT
jgi:phospholipase C